MATDKGTIALIPSAGLGTRMAASGKKNYLSLAGRPVLARAIAAFDASPSIDAIVVAVTDEDAAAVRGELVPSWGFAKPVTVVSGGATRQESVYRAFMAAKASAYEVVAVHDGARPLVTPELIEAVVAEARRSGAAIAAVPVKDTIKETADGAVLRTVPRERLRAAQTPQCFRAGILGKALELAVADGFIGTDEGSLVERTGAPVRIVAGSYENIKITTVEDMAAAEAILARRASR